MVEAKPLSPVALKEIKVILAELACLAERGDAMYFHFMNHGADSDEVETLHTTMRNFIGRMGLLADVAPGKIGGDQLKERPEEWLLPPAYRWPSEIASQQTRAQAEVRHG
jgi:hypothetical protein